MRVEKDTVIYVGNASAPDEKAGGQKQKKSIFAGELQPDNLQNRIEQKKKQAREKAMKVIGDARAGDKSIDDDLDKRRDTVKNLQQEKLELQEQLNGLKEEQERLGKLSDITEDVEEHKEALQEEIEDYQKLLDKNRAEIMGENAVIRGTELERLKYAPMVKAGKQAEEIMEAASQEIIGMVVEDAKDHIDEEQEKREEKAEEIKEEREEQEERIEKKKEQDALTEEIPVEEIINLDKSKDELQTDVKKILDEMKLLAEDIKGAVVDKEI